MIARVTSPAAWIALALAACGTNPRATDAGTGLDSHVNTPPHDGPEPCVDPCFATDVFDGFATSMVVRDGIIYLASAAPTGPHGRNLIGTIRALGPSKRITVLARDQSAPVLPRRR
jgi:hypothetical protein